MSPTFLQMTDDVHKGPRRVRLAWRWKLSGTTGTGPWTHRSDVVEGWFESLTQRWGDTVEHWIEIDTGEVPDSRSMRAWGRVEDARSGIDVSRNSHT
jgi:hypothetical protein